MSKSKENTLTLHSKDTDNCRVYVTGDHSLYCFQKEDTSLPPFLYVCTKDGEPEYKVTIPESTKLDLKKCSYLKEEIVTAFNRGDYCIKPTLSKSRRAELETDFKYVTADIVWVGQSQQPETVTISNTSEYLDLETCGFCGKCKNCLHDNSIHYYVNSLTELDTLMKKAHDDGWMIKSYSVQDITLDLFEFYDQQPPELKDICRHYEAGDLSYQQCEEFLHQVEHIGFTFDYGLDAEPFNLRSK